MSSCGNAVSSCVQLCPAVVMLCPAVCNFVRLLSSYIHVLWTVDSCIYLRMQNDSNVLKYVCDTLFQVTTIPYSLYW